MRRGEECEVQLRYVGNAPGQVLAVGDSRVVHQLHSTTTQNTTMNHDDKETVQCILFVMSMSSECGINVSRSYLVPL